MALELLSLPIRKYIWEQGWEALRPIQLAAIPRILQSSDHFVLASRTASGKTEAAFLPILSKLDFSRPGLRILYVSPLIALINDQLIRIEALCQHLDIPVTPWHGEANTAAKNRLLANPRGIALITPESLEAMFVHNPQRLARLFGSLQYVVVDEIHAFLGTNRGLQLQSLLSRLRQLASFSIVGLSATIGDYQQAKAFTGDPDHTRVLVDKSGRDTIASLHYFDNPLSGDLPPALLQHLYLHTYNRQVLIFPNSRARTEEVAAGLTALSKASGGHPHYFAHHASVSKHERTAIEQFAKENNRQPFCIACTSTLELGIDIGSVDQVVQLDAAYSVASLLQRAGRSGRRQEELSSLALYATNPWSLLQSLACWQLLTEGFVEPPADCTRAYDMLIHQALSIVAQQGGINKDTLSQALARNSAFQDIPIPTIEHILRHAVGQGLLEQLGGELIIGPATERLVHSRQFYAAFQSAEQFSVLHEGRLIGQLPDSVTLLPGEHILLAAKAWLVVAKEYHRRHIEVVPAAAGQKPLFGGEGGEVHPHIRHRMLGLLTSCQLPALLDLPAQAALLRLRADFCFFDAKMLPQGRPLQPLGEELLAWYTFGGSRTNRALCFLLRAQGVGCSLDEAASLITLRIGLDDFLANRQRWAADEAAVDRQLLAFVEKKEASRSFSKWAWLLPANYQCDLLKRRYFDFEGARQLLATFVPVIP